MSEQGYGQESLPGNSGSGPGVITPDGCAVDFYALLPPGREPEIIHKAAGRAGASILELGSGTGRITDALAKLGHPVVIVDESPEMLARNRSAETVCARIEDLALSGSPARQLPSPRCASMRCSSRRHWARRAWC